MAPARHPLVMTQRWVLLIALVVAVACAAGATSQLARAGAIAIALAIAAAALWQQRTRPVLVLDDDGYAIEQRGRETLRVAWREVKRVRADEGELALYVDVGEPGRNLLVPPARGYGFRFAGAAALFARVLASVPAERVERVERLDAPPPAPPP
jgi:hypothetical protein